jgi:hypothetical protein
MEKGIALTTLEAVENRQSLTLKNRGGVFFSNEQKLTTKIETLTPQYDHIII